MEKRNLQRLYQKWKLVISYFKVYSILFLQLFIKEKNDYNNQLASKLNKPETSPRTYWSILKSFYSEKKITLIPVLLHKNKLISDFREKANFFNNFFASQYTIFANNSTVPDIQSTKPNQGFHL